MNTDLIIDWEPYRLLLVSLANRKPNKDPYNWRSYESKSICYICEKPIARFDDPRGHGLKHLKDHNLLAFI